MWLANLKIVLPDEVIAQGAICIEEGMIQAVRADAAPEPAFDCSGLTAIPGLIDLHGDMLEREISPRPQSEFPIDLALAEVDKRLAGSGVTTAFAAVSFHWHNNKPLRSEEWARKIIQIVNDMRPVLLTDHYVHARFEITNPEGGEVLKELLEKDQVRLVSIMDHTPGQGQYRDIEHYVQFAIEWAKQQDGHDISEEEMRRRIAEAQKRPKAWKAVNDLTAIAREHGITLASHDDDTLEKVELMASLGVNISEFPVTYQAGQKAKEKGIHVLMGAPNAYRGVSTTTGNLSAQEAIQEGFVDTLASDYYPAAMIQAPFRLAQKQVLSLPEAIKLVSLNAAEALNMNDRGAIEAGRRADIALVEEAAHVRVHAVLREGLPIYWDRTMAQRRHPIDTSNLMSTTTPR